MRNEKKKEVEEEEAEGQQQQIEDEEEEEEKEVVLRVDNVTNGLALFIVHVTQVSYWWQSKVKRLWVGQLSEISVLNRYSLKKICYNFYILVTF